MPVVRIVVADDSDSFRAALERLVDRHPRLDLAGSAADGLEAKTLIDLRRPDLALLDDQMPGLRGIELAEELHADGGPAVVIITANPEPELLRRAEQVDVPVLDKATGAREIADCCLAQVPDRGEDR